jgi:hypothetical protein
VRDGERLGTEEKMDSERERDIERGMANGGCAYLRERVREIERDG